SIVAAECRTCALLQNGKRRCWGASDDGNSCGLGRPRHSCTVLADGSVACRGNNDFGQLGDGTEEERGGPVRVRGISNAAEGVAGQVSNCARTNEGRVFCGGENSYGELGDGTTESKAEPTEVAFCAKNAEPILFEPPEGVALVAGLRRIPCYGRCPEYSIRVYADGTVIYRGLNYVRVRSGRRIKLAPATLRTVLDLFRKNDFLHFKYECGGGWTDDAWVELFFADGGHSRGVHHYLGCSNAPQFLTKLETEFEQLVGSERWVGSPAYLRRIMWWPSDIEGTDYD